jgi:hypothetical protein
MNKTALVSAVLAWVQESALPTGKPHVALFLNFSFFSHTAPRCISVLQIVKDRGDPSTGMSISDIASNCQMPRDVVSRLMEQLSNDGKVIFCFFIMIDFSPHFYCIPSGLQHCG